MKNTILAREKGFKTCGGCRALFKTTNNGNPFVWCNLDKQMMVNSFLSNK